MEKTCLTTLDGHFGGAEMQRIEILALGPRPLCLLRLCDCEVI